jgi:phosphotransferase system HPr (HPr) family protein
MSQEITLSADSTELADTLATAVEDHAAPERSGNYTFIGTAGWRFTQLVALIKTASMFTAEVQIRNDRCTVDGKSLVDLLTLGVRFGDKLTIQTSGYDAQEALTSVAALPFFTPLA